MSKLLREIWETLASIAPVFLLVLILQLVFGFLSGGMLVRWIFGSVLAAAGLFLFLRGVEYALQPLGDMLGARFPLAPNLAALIILALIIGAFANAADPAVMVLATHVQTVGGPGAPPPWLLLGAVVLGVGVFLVLALLRIALSIPAALALGACYGLMLLAAIFSPPAFVPLALDSGGVSTGPLTVPFLLSIGTGFVSVLRGKSASHDGFGVLGLVALGPIFGVLLLGLLWN